MIRLNLFEDYPIELFLQNTAFMILPHMRLWPDGCNSLLIGGVDGESAVTSLTTWITCVDTPI